MERVGCDRSRGRLCGIDFASLCERAEAQETEVDHWRLKLAPNAL